MNPGISKTRVEKFDSAFKSVYAWFGLLLVGVVVGVALSLVSANSTGGV